MPEYVLNRKHTLRSTHGHVINFEKGQPTYVPPTVEREAIALGADCVDGKGFDPLGPEAQAERQLSLDDIKTALFAAFVKIVARNDAKDFTGAGQPTPSAVEKIVGFTVDKSDIKTAWAEFKIKDED